MRLMDLLANRKLDGRTEFQGLQISVENAKGGTRKGIDSDGKPWKVTMTWPYGYIRMSEGVDGDHVDCFIGPNKDATHAYVIHTKNPKTGEYDEDKCMLGFDSAEAAKKAFLDNYTSPKFFGSLEAVPMATFKKKVLETRTRPAKIAASVLLGGGAGSGCRGPNCGRKASARIQKMTSDTWVSKDGTAVKVWKMNNGHLTNVLRQLHQQLALARGEKVMNVQTMMYEDKALSGDGKVIERAIPPYRAMVKEAQKRGLHW